jgi:hypothetical protein
MDKWLNLYKIGTDADTDATKRHLMYKKENMMSDFFNFALHFKTVTVMNNLFV